MIAVAKGKKEKLEVVSERDRREQIVLTNAEDSSVRIFLSSGVISPKVKESLIKAGALKGKWESARREVIGLEKELKDLVEDQR